MPLVFAVAQGRVRRGQAAGLSLLIREGGEDQEEKLLSSESRQRKALGIFTKPLEG